jgi:secreted trypsin-like serine protease
MAKGANTALFTKNELLFHFLRSELQTAEMVAMRVYGKDGLNALASSERYTTTVALIDSIRSDDEIAEQEEPESLC